MPNILQRQALMAQSRKLRTQETARQIVFDATAKFQMRDHKGILPDYVQAIYQEWACGRTEEVREAVRAELAAIGYEVN